MWWLDSSDTVLVIAAVSGCLSALIAVWCQNMRKSRCTHTQICCGLISCKRDVETAEELAIELAAEHGAAAPGQTPVGATPVGSQQSDPEGQSRV